MTKREFFNKVTNSKVDFLQEFINLLKEHKIPFCVIGGFGVNAYAEPLVTLDCDIVIAERDIGRIIPDIKKHWKIEEFKQSINVYCQHSDIRIQIQTDPKLQKCLKEATEKDILGYKLPVASIEGIFESKIVALLEPKRRESKRKKDETDIIRLIEVKKELKALLPEKVKNMLKLK